MLTGGSANGADGRRKLKRSIGIVLGLLAAAAAPGGAEDFQAKVRTVLPQAAEFRESGARSYAILDASGRTLGVLQLERLDDRQRKLGYGGVIEIALVVNTEDEIVGVLVGRNQETPRFLNRVVASDFLKQWNKMTLARAATADVDAVSGATYTSTAIAYGVKKLSAALLAERQEPESKVQSAAPGHAD